MSIPAPLELHRDVVRSEWIDYNGHMNLAYYVLMFDHATDEFLDWIGITESFRSATATSTFAAEIHVTYHREVHRGDEVIVRTQLLDYDAKRFHFFHSMYHATGGHLVATNEIMSLFMDMQARGVGVMPEQICQRLQLLLESHAALGTPEQAGRTIGMRRKRKG